MALLLKWRKSNVALFDQSDGEPDEGQLIDQIGLDFELGPLSFTFEEEKHRLLAALAQLKASAGDYGDQVDLFIPAEWGIAHQVPNAELPAGELESHLQWELSKAIVDSHDQYRFNYLVGTDGTVILTALRIRLLDAIHQVMQDSGFKLRGVFLDGDPWNRVNIADSREHRIPEPSETVTKTAEKTELEVDRKSSSYESRSKRSSGSSAFLVIVLAVLLIGGGYAVWKFVLQKPSTEIQQPVTQDEEAVQEEPETSTTVEPPAEQQQPAPETEASVQWADMIQRLTILRQVLSAFSGQNKFDLISFTENHFICQLIGPDKGNVENTAALLQQINGLTQFKLSSGTEAMGVYRSTLNASIVARQNGTMIAPSQEGLITLAKQHNVSNRDLIFTGTHADILAFLDDIASHKFAIYRLIITPWGDDQYRTVLEL